MPQSIRALRDDRGWTQQDLADKIGVSKTAVYLWETGRRVPLVTQWKRLAGAFDVGMDDIEIPVPLGSATPELE